MRAPRTYQIIDGREVEVASHYRLHPDGLSSTSTISFAVGDYDTGRPLVIDPVVVYASYLGGSGQDAGFGIAVDGTGAAYVTGETTSLDFLGGMPPRMSLGGMDVFVTKLAPGGGSVEYTTYLSGSGDDTGADIAVDAAGAAYITGRTDSTDFPATLGVVQGSLQGSSDAFVAKLDAAGTLAYATYLGGAWLQLTPGTCSLSGQCTGPDRGHGIAVDAGGNAYVTGTTGSKYYPASMFVCETLGFPVTGGAFQSNNASTSDCRSDAFVSKLNPTGTALLYSTYLGGNGEDEDGYDIAVDATGNICVTGWGTSVFPTTVGTAQPIYGGYNNDAFVAKLDPSAMGAASLVYSTFIGGDNVDEGRAIAVDGLGQVVVAGSTFSSNFPGTATSAIMAAVPAYQDSLATNRDGFVAKLSADATTFLFSTYFGGGGFDEVLGVVVHSDDTIFLTGRTQAAQAPMVPSPWVVHTPGGCGATGLYDAFITRMAVTGESLVHSTYVGGTGTDYGYGIAVDATGAAYITGLTQSTDFPVQGAVQGTKAASNEAFIATVPTKGCEDDFDMDGYLPSEGDCDDMVAAINPGATDSCDGVDDDCDMTDDDDHVETPTTCGVGACAAAGVNACQAGMVVDTCNPGIPAPDDSTCDGVDDDCDTEDDENYSPVATTCGVGACASIGTTSCVGGMVLDDCTAGAPAMSDPTCDGVDDDCDTDDDEDYSPVPTTCGTGACAATGTTSCVAGVVVDDCIAGLPAASDSTCDGIDDNCNGPADEDYMPIPTTCGTGPCAATGQLVCNAGVITDTCTPGPPPPDDADCDGVIDNPAPGTPGADPSDPGGGCSCGSGGSPILGLALAVPFLLRRRRRKRRAGSQ